VRRGPIESNSVCASFCTWELSIPRRKMRSTVGSLDCAASGSRRG
jgi:hypothetical protein